MSRRGTPAVVISEVVLVSLVLGALAGWVWERLTPTVVGTVIDTPRGLDATVGVGQATGFFAAQAWFTVATAVAALVATGWVLLRHRSTPVAGVSGLVVGGLLGALTTWQAGIALGPSPLGPRLADATVGDEIAVPVGIDAYAVLFVWAIVAVAAVLLFAAVRPDTRPWRPPGAASASAGSARAGDRRELRSGEENQVGG